MNQASLAFMRMEEWVFGWYLQDFLPLLVLDDIY